MARLCDLPSDYEKIMRERSYPPFDWRPGALLTKDLSQVKLAVVTTAAYHLPGQQPFDTRAGHNDSSYRIIPGDVDVQSLMISHKSDAFDWPALNEDKGIALPLPRLRELVSAGGLGALNSRHFSFMGSLSDPSGVRQQTGPEVAALLKADAVDAVLLTPV